jgi:hypothetical protein
MELREFATVVGAEPKWVLNALTSLALCQRYDITSAIRLMTLREIQREFAVPLARALEMADQALTKWRASGGSPVVVGANDTSVTLQIDIHRMLSAMYTRQSVVLTSPSLRAAGRPVKQNHDRLAAATAWGIDLGLLADSLRKTPAQRLRQLDAMVAFRAGVRRGARESR